MQSKYSNGKIRIDHDLRNQMLRESSRGQRHSRKKCLCNKGTKAICDWEDRRGAEKNGHSERAIGPNPRIVCLTQHSPEEKKQRFSQFCCSSQRGSHILAVAYLQIPGYYFEEAAKIDRGGRRKASEECSQSSKMGKGVVVPEFSTSRRVERMAKTPRERNTSSHNESQKHVYSEIGKPYLEPQGHQKGNSHCYFYSSRDRSFLAGAFLQTKLSPIFPGA